MELKTYTPVNLKFVFEKIKFKVLYYVQHNFTRQCLGLSKDQISMFIRDVCISRAPALALVPNLYLPALALNLYLPALAPNSYLPSLIPNLYLLALVPSLYLPALAPNFYLPALAPTLCLLQICIYQLSPGSEFAYTNLVSPICIYWPWPTICTRTGS